MAQVNIIEVAKKCLLTEVSALESLTAFINADFVLAIETIFKANGRLIISGIGKSAIIAQKIVATLNSTGTPSIFLHAADAIHGDLGIVQPDDVVMIISKSGESPEIKVLVPLIKNFGNKVIGMVGNVNGYLAKHCDIIINTTVTEEACPNNLAPTSSTTAQMVFGDAIAVTLMELHGFSANDFAKFHPGGMLGKKLYLRVEDLYTQNSKPSITLDSNIKEIIVSISQNRLGATVVVNNDNTIQGLITDGDLRRMLEQQEDINRLVAKDIMTHNPLVIPPNALAIEVLDILRKKNITQLIVAENNLYLGIIHIHDIVREGLV
jgi:arabinose-5-phosphate isomerase